VELLDYECQRLERNQSTQSAVKNFISVHFCRIKIYDENFENTEWRDHIHQFRWQNKWRLHIKSSSFHFKGSETIWAYYCMDL